MNEAPRLVRFDCVKEGATMSILAVFDRDLERAEAYILLGRELQRLAEKKP